MLHKEVIIYFFEDKLSSRRCGRCNSDSFYQIAPYQPNTYTCDNFDCNKLHESSTGDNESATAVPMAMCMNCNRFVLLQ